jgi:hypothetical protein
VDVQAVIDSAARTFVTHAELTSVDPIIVLQSTEQFPRALSHPAPTGERIITLATTNRRWSQFAHEYCHVFTKHYRSPLDHPFMWFEESLCELASLWCLNWMSRDWKSCPPYPHWASYADSLEEYAKQRFDGVIEHGSPQEFRAWLDSNLEEMISNPINRDLNLVVAVRIYPQFHTDPASWRAVQLLNEDPALDGDFYSYLTRWHGTVSDDARTSVAAIAELLGFPIDNRTEQVGGGKRE